jgi:signal transduction histidine kinase
LSASPVPGRLAKASLRRRLSGVFAVGAVLLAAMTLVVVVSFVRLVHARHLIINQLDPASLASDQLLTGYINQETGVRGYVLSGNTNFLAPYQEGQVQQTQASAQLGTLLASEPALVSLVRAAEARGAAWQDQSATPAVAATGSGLGPYATDAALTQSKLLFDQVRTAFTHLDAALAADRSNARGRLDSSTTQLVAVLGLVLALLIALGVASARALRRWVTDPLTEVGGHARQVTAGDLTHEIPSVGPPELGALAEDTEQMRRRILRELDAVAGARAELKVLNEDLARSNLELEQFAYVASHDLQEPLRKVTSFCQLLQARYGGQLDEQADQYIGYAVDGAKRMQALINDLLAFSRVGRAMEEVRSVDLAACAESAVHNLGAAIEEAHARVVIGSLPTVDGIPTLLTTLLQNLIGNAIKFRGPEDPVVAVGAERRDGEWLLSVSDNGIGIAPRFADRIFVIFQRLHAREEYAGTGIGLAMCKKIVESHGGRIWLDTGEAPDADEERYAKPRPGTRFCFTLPVAAPVPEPVPPVSQQGVSRT